MRRTKAIGGGASSDPQRGGGVARGHGVGLLAFGGAYWPLALAHSGAREESAPPPLPSRVSVGASTKAHTAPGVFSGLPSAGVSIAVAFRSWLVLLWL